MFGNMERDKKISVLRTLAEETNVTIDLLTKKLDQVVNESEKYHRKHEDSLAFEVEKLHQEMFKLHQGIDKIKKGKWEIVVVFLFTRFCLCGGLSEKYYV